MKEEARLLIAECTEHIKSCMKFKSDNYNEVLRNKQEFLRLQKRRKKAKEDMALFGQIMSYMNVDNPESSLEDQRNSLMIKLRTIDERLKYDYSGNIRMAQAPDGQFIEAPLSRSTKNPEEKKLIEKHDRTYGVKELKQQLKIINFILNN